jgi:acetyl esterase/lipase
MAGENYVVASAMHIFKNGPTMRRLSVLFSLLCALTVSGCAQLGIFAANVPSHFSDTVRKDNITFSAEQKLKLDVYTPKNPLNADVVVFFYGGRWTDGTKEQYRFVGSALAKQGFVVVIPDYRKYPNVKFPSFVDDAAQAVAWTSDNIAEYGGNPERIHLSGHSSGAHLAALVATDPTYLKKFGKNRDAVVKSFAGLAGPYDFTPEDADLVDMFGPPEKYPLMRPVTYADGRTPPLLLLHGADDTIVGRFNYENFEKKILAHGGCVTTKLYKDIDHVWIVGAISWLGSNKAPVIKDLSAFFKNPECKAGSHL